MKAALFLSVMALTLAPFNVRAEDSMQMDHSKMGHSKTIPTDKPNDVYADAMAKMHKDMMDVKPTGDADVDFVRGMIPHHQGAIDMAKVVLKEGKDSEIKKLAEGIVAAQESEIKIMNDWLKTHQK